MKKLLLPTILILILSSFVWAQNPAPAPPDCVVFLNNLTSAQSVPSGNGFDNRFIGCTAWTVQYQSTGFTGLTLAFQSSVGSTTPTAFGAYTGTVVTGAQSMTNTTGQISTYSNGTVVTPWVRVNLSGLVNVGTLNGVLYGYKTGYTGGGGSIPPGSSCPGTVGTPCVVVGPASVGTVLAGAPVLQGVSDGTNAQYAFSCTNQALVTITAGTDAVIVTGTAAKTTRICHLDFASDTQATFTIRQGTGTTCGTSTATIAGPYPNLLALAEDFTPVAPLLTTVVARDICLHSSTNVTVGGVVIYAQF